MASRAPPGRDRRGSRSGTPPRLRQDRPLAAPSGRHPGAGTLYLLVIQRPAIDPAYFEQFAAEQQALLEKLYPRLQSRPRLVANLHTTARNLFMAVAGLEGRDHDLRTAARLATTSGTVLFRFLAGEPQIDVDLAGHSLRLAFHEPDDAGAPLFCDVIALALICRDRDAIAHLAAVDTSLLRGARSTTDDYQHPWAAALQQWARGHDPGTWLAATREALAHAEIATPVVQRRTLGLVEALESLGRGDHHGFDRGLRLAVQAHHDHWTRGDLRFRYDGFVALQQLGVACRALDLGVTVDLDSGYLPPALLDWR